MLQALRQDQFFKIPVVGERLPFDHFHRIRERHFFQIRAFVKCFHTDLFKPFPNMHGKQFETTRKSSFSDLAKHAFEGHFPQCTAREKGPSAQCLQRRREGDGPDSSAAGENAVLEDLHAFFDLYVSQPGTGLKAVPAEPFHAARDPDLRQPGTTLKGSPADIGNAVWNLHVPQHHSFVECIRRDHRSPVRDQCFFYISSCFYQNASDENEVFFPFGLVLGVIFVPRGPGENIPADFYHAGRADHFAQIDAKMKGFRTDLRDGRRDCDLMQIPAVAESAFADDGDAVRDSDAGFRAGVFDQYAVFDHKIVHALLLSCQQHLLFVILRKSATER